MTQQRLIGYFELQYEGRLLRGMDTCSVTSTLQNGCCLPSEKGSTLIRNLSYVIELAPHAKMIVAFLLKRIYSKRTEFAVKTAVASLLKRISYKRKEFAGSKFFPFKVDPFLKGIHV